MVDRLETVTALAREAVVCATVLTCARRAEIVTAFEGVHSLLRSAQPAQRGRRLVFAAAQRHLAEAEAHLLSHLRGERPARLPDRIMLAEAHSLCAQLRLQLAALSAEARQ